MQCKVGRAVQLLECFLNFFIQFIFHKAHFFSLAVFPCTPLPTIHFTFQFWFTAVLSALTCSAQTVFPSHFITMAACLDIAVAIP